MNKDTLVVSDAGPLIQLAISDHLSLLPKLYSILIPEAVFVETQHYDDLPDAIEIAKPTKSWLAVKEVRNRSEVRRLIKNRKLGRGEAEAIVLCNNRILAASEARELINTFIDQSILDTQYIRNLREEAKSWL